MGFLEHLAMKYLGKGRKLQCVNIELGVGLYPTRVLKKLLPERRTSP